MIIENTGQILEEQMCQEARGALEQHIYIYMTKEHKECPLKRSHECHCHLRAFIYFVC